MTTEHKVKCWPPLYQDMLDGKKTFDFRKNDRNYKVGDVIVQREWKPETEEYTGRGCGVKITYLLEGGQFGIPEGYCIMGIKPCVELQKEAL